MAPGDMELPYTTSREAGSFTSRGPVPWALPAVVLWGFLRIVTPMAQAVEFAAGRTVSAPCCRPTVTSGGSRRCAGNSSAPVLSPAARLAHKRGL